MMRRIPKKYRHKYAKPMPFETEIVTFALKVIGPVALFFVAAIGLDVYSLIR